MVSGTSRPWTCCVLHSRPCGAWCFLWCFTMLYLNSQIPLLFLRSINRCMLFHSASVESINVAGVGLVPYRRVLIVLPCDVFRLDFCLLDYCTDWWLKNTLLVVSSGVLPTPKREADRNVWEWNERADWMVLFPVLLILPKMVVSWVNVSTLSVRKQNTCLSPPVTRLL